MDHDIEHQKEGGLEAQKARDSTPRSKKLSLSSSSGRSETTTAVKNSNSSEDSSEDEEKDKSMNDITSKEPFSDPPEVDGQSEEGEGLMDLSDDEEVNNVSAVASKEPFSSPGDDSPLDDSDSPMDSSEDSTEIEPTASIKEKDGKSGSTTGANTESLSSGLLEEKGSKTVAFVKLMQPTPSEDKADDMDVESGAGNGECYPVNGVGHQIYQTLMEATIWRSRQRRLMKTATLQAGLNIWYV